MYVMNWQYLQSDTYHINGLFQLRMACTLCKFFTYPDPEGTNGNASLEKKRKRRKTLMKFKVLNLISGPNFLDIFKGQNI